MTQERSDHDTVAVVGGGLAGLSAACTLAARGHQVTLYEANDWLGGKAAQLEGGGFRFDMGPTILTMPRVLRRVYEEAGRKLEDEMELVRLDPQWRCFYEDGSVLDLSEDVELMSRVLDDFTSDGRSPDGYRDFIALSERLHEVSERFFFWKSIEDLRDTMDWRSGFDVSTLKDVLALRMGRSVAQTVRKFVPDDRVSQMLDHFTQYVGSSPMASPAVLCGIAHMQVAEGIWYPMGGTRAVAEGLASLAGELGVDLRTGCGVEKILTTQGRVSGLRTTAGEVCSHRTVVSNMDAVRTYAQLVGGEIGDRFERKRSFEPACSGVVLYLGLRERYEHLLHHDFVFSEDPEVEFDWIYRKGEPAPDPTVYLCAPARTDPDVAPEGGEALYVLVHAPYLRPHHDWSKMLPDYRRIILDKLERCAGLEGLEERIVYESALTPQDIHDRYRVLNGAIYGLASHGKYLGAFKPGNRSRELPGLYLAGGAAHPGPGMPMVLMSGWIAADTLDRDSGAETVAATATATA